MFTKELRIKDGVTKTGDPRIDSPLIKVVYPSDPLAVTPPTANGISVGEKPQSSETLQTKELFVASPEPIKKDITGQAPEPPKQSWFQPLVDNKLLFAGVALIAVVIGVVIGKKM